MNESEKRAPDEKSSSVIKTRSWWIDNVVSLGFALLLVFTIRSSFVEAFKIPSGSMIPTLLVGDHIFVNKFSYGFNLPFWDWFRTDPVTLISRDPPKRGEIIVFKFPKDESLYYIKRVIGTPGDTVELRNKQLFINNQPVQNSPVSEEMVNRYKKSIENSNYNLDQLEFHKEKLGDHDAVIMLDRTNYFTENFGPITVPSESYFVMGDNRDFSNDSRFWGFVPFRNVRGRAMVIWLSAWISFSDDQYYFRPTRTGTILE